MTDVLATQASGPGAGPARKYGASVSDVCVMCTKAVYPVEKLTADNKILHKACLRCGHCKKQLSLGNYASLNGTFYCKPHFKQLFALKGNYTDGFAASASQTGSQSKEDERSLNASVNNGANGEQTRSLDSNVTSGKSLADRLHAYQNQVTKAHSPELSRASSANHLAKDRDAEQHHIEQTSTPQPKAQAQNESRDTSSSELETLRRQLEKEVAARKKADDEKSELKNQLSKRDSELKQLRNEVEDLKIQLKTTLKESVDQGTATKNKKHEEGESERSEDSDSKEWDD